MKPDPQLQKAVKEIKEICKKYDVGAHITLASKEHGEYLLHFPQWSKCQTEEVNGELVLRFKAKGKDEDRSVVGTVHMLQVFQNVARQIDRYTDHLLEKLEAKMFISGGPKRL